MLCLLLITCVRFFVGATLCIKLQVCDLQPPIYYRVRACLSVELTTCLPVQLASSAGEVIKQCGRCGQTKTAPCFSPDETTFDGLHPVCRMCAGNKALVPRLRVEEGSPAAPPHWLTGSAQGLALASLPKATPRQGFMGI